MRSESELKAESEILSSDPSPDTDLDESSKLSPALPDGWLAFLSKVGDGERSLSFALKDPAALLPWLWDSASCVQSATLGGFVDRGLLSSDILALLRSVS